MLEYWNIGILGRERESYSNIPSFHYSISGTPVYF
jgi:hypothetical protein